MSNVYARLKLETTAFYRIFCEILAFSNIFSNEIIRCGGECCFAHSTL